jgi:hypothetical protein
MIVLIILLVLLTVLLIIVGLFAYRCARALIDVEDALTDALDMCDTTYNGLSALLELPVAVDTPEVRDVIEKMRMTRDAVLYVSNVLANPFGGVVEEIDAQE